MAEGSGVQVFTDAVWAVWEPLIEAVRPRGKTAPKELRRTIAAIVWRHQNGAKWRSIPAELGPWSRAAQLFIRWAKKGVWEDLLDLVQQRGVALGMTFIDGTTIRAHHKAAGAEKRGSTARSEMSVRRWAALGAAEPAPDLIRGHQGVRDRRWPWTGHCLCARARAGARAADGAGSARRPARCAGLDRG